jgi:flagellar biosynthesis/type III secretory pathway chaperone
MAHHPLPNAEAMKAMNVNELMHATLRLSDIMAEESELLDAHRYHDIAKLHDEKLRLTGLLESYQHAMATNPNFLKSVDGGTREELLLRADDLAYNVEGTFRKVSVARAVNQRILQAIRDAMSEQHSPSVYGRNGMTATSDEMTLSMNLNQKA